MLEELAVENLGVISRLRLVLGQGMTVVTGETGAGKTLIVDAIALLAGGRADPSAVREGAHEAVVEGRFVSDDGSQETIVRRVIPSRGRSRAYLDGQMATVSTLAEVVNRHVDLYAQHAQHSLLGVAGQRAALDRYAGTDLEDLHRSRARRNRIRDELESLGGDDATREREMDLLRYQVRELDEAKIDDPDEDRHLADEQARLSDVGANRARAQQALGALADDAGASELVGRAIGSLVGSEAFASEHERLVGLAAELGDVTSELRRSIETIAEDPERLEAILERRQLLATLRRRHGDGTLEGVIVEQARLAARLADLEHAEERGAQLSESLHRADADVERCAAAVARHRRRAAPALATDVGIELRELAMPAARFEIRVGDRDPGDDIEMRFTANPGTSPVSLAKSASGGELARAMLALRLVAASDQETVVFDEVDAGIGGTAAIAVGEALARLGKDRQVLVVTHLAQVAAAADHQIRVVKISDATTTSTSAEAVTGEERVVELSRMLSGQPTSDAARAHARELLDRTLRSSGV